MNSRKLVKKTKACGTKKRRSCSILVWVNDDKFCGDCGHSLPKDFHFGSSYVWK